jgi:hypothetical protein
LIPATATITLNEEHDDWRWIDEGEVNANFVWRSQRQALAAIMELLREYPERIELLLV